MVREAILDDLMSVSYIIIVGWWPGFSLLDLYLIDYYGWPSRWESLRV